jgi:endonuclease/exonuclease/phosphatase family metal-dependent hydrolase
MHLRSVEVRSNAQRRSERRRLRGLALALVAMAVIAFGAVPATAGSAPATPTGVRQTAATATSLTVSGNASAYATGYRLYASTTRSSLYIANIGSAIRSATYSTPSATISGLTYTTSPYYYRFAAVNSSGVRYGTEILTGYLRPAAPTGITVSSSIAGTTIKWTSGPARTFRIARATNAAMTTGRVHYNITSQARQYTPYGLVRGTRYYFAVAAMNGLVASYGAPVSVVAAPREVSVRVLTYNVLHAGAAGQYSGDGTIAAWSDRRPKVVSLIQSSAADLVAVQEGSAWIGSIQGRGGIRQVDDLKNALGSTYSLARTEIPPSEPGYFRTGRYILYRNTTYRTIGSGGYWTIGTARYAAYQVMENRATGARLLFVSVHLSAAAGTSTGDAERKAETESLIRQASAYAASQRVPVVYAGDFNSHTGPGHAFDGPALAFGAVRATDAAETAQFKVNPTYNSANGHYRTPPATSHSVDHIYAPPGVSLRTWRLGLQLTSGMFVGAIPSDHNPLASDATIPY